MNENGMCFISKSKNARVLSLMTERGGGYCILIVKISKENGLLLLGGLKLLNSHFLQVFPHHKVTCNNWKIMPRTASFRKRRMQLSLCRMFWKENMMRL